MPNWKKLISSGSNISQLNNDSGYITSYVNTMGSGFKIANSAGTDQFTVTENEKIRFAGSGATSVSFDSSTQKVTISSTDTNTNTNTQNTYSTSVVSSSGIKLRLSGAGHNGNTTDDVKFVGAGATSVSRTDASTITITSTDTNTDTNTVTQIREDSGDYRTGNITLQSGTNVTISEPSEGVFNIASTDTNTQATRGTLGIDTDDDVTFDDIIAGGTSKSANTTIKALAGDSYRAGFEAYGSSQGTGYLFVGQSSTYGGGISYNGDNSPAFVSGESSDAITFFRRSNGSDSEVFHYSYNADTVNFNGDIVAYHSSDKRLKTNILPIESALDKIDKLGGYTFDWIPTEEVHSNEGTDIGVIAQEIEEQFPELVTTRENGYKAVKYDKLVAVLLQGIKELRQEIRDCKASK